MTIQTAEQEQAFKELKQNLHKFEHGIISRERWQAINDLIINAYWKHK